MGNGSSSVPSTRLANLWEIALADHPCNELQSNQAIDHPNICEVQTVKLLVPTPSCVLEEFGMRQISVLLHRKRERYQELCRKPNP